MDLPVRVQKELLVCYDVGNLDRLAARRAAAILNVSLPTLRALLKNRKAIDGRHEKSEPFPFLRTEGDVVVAKAQNGSKRRNPPMRVPACVSEDGRPAGRAPVDRTVFDGYDAEDVYGLVETGLYGYSPGPMTVGRAPHCTVLFVTNLTGTDKKPPVVRATAAGGDPRLVDDAKSFRRARWVAVDYATFLHKWDGELSQKPRRTILLILDNRWARPTVPLRNIEIRRLPESYNFHPLGLCIARIARTCEGYEKELAVRELRTDRCDTVHERCDRNCDVVTVSESLDTLADAWEVVISPALIRNCFRAIGLVKTGAEDDCVDSNFKRLVDRRRRRRRQQLIAYHGFGNTTAENTFQYVNLENLPFVPSTPRDTL